MKRFTIALLAGAVCGAAFAEDSVTNTVTINFTGRIIEETCSFDSQSKDKTVDLGVYSLSYFKSGNTETELKPFNLNISGCTLSQAGSQENLPTNHVRLTFTDTNNKSSAQSNGLLTNGATDDAAENIGILVQYKGSEDPKAQLFENNSTGKQIRELQDFDIGELPSNNAQLEFFAAMKRTSDSAEPTAGKVSGQMTVLLETF